MTEANHEAALASDSEKCIEGGSALWRLEAARRHDEINGNVNEVNANERTKLCRWKEGEANLAYAPSCAGGRIGRGWGAAGGEKGQHAESFRNFLRATSTHPEWFLRLFRFTTLNGKKGTNKPKGSARLP